MDTQTRRNRLPGHVLCTYWAYNRSVEAGSECYKRFFLSSLECCRAGFCRDRAMCYVKRGIFMLMRGGGTRWCVDLDQARGTMASRPRLAVYAGCHASKQMCSSARWALRCARPQADIHAIHSRIVPKCGFVPMARSCGYRSASMILEARGPIEGWGLMKTVY